MLTVASSSTSWFGARTVVALAGVCCVLVIVLGANTAHAQQQGADGCRIECYPNTKMINGKGGVTSMSSGKKENCRWILRTDGKPARLCDHILCKKICPHQTTHAQQQVEQQDTASSSENAHIEQQVEPDAPLSLSSVQEKPAESMGIMRQLHGNKLAKAPVPGVAGGRLSSSNNGNQQQQQQQQANGARRMAPTLAPSVEYDEKDTPPPISRFLDISPEE